jgi:hypothetical protein
MTPTGAASVAPLARRDHMNITVKAYRLDGSEDY